MANKTTLSKDIKTAFTGCCKGLVSWLQSFGEPESKEVTTKKPKRARGKKGKFKADDKSTPNVNEAGVGGKAPNGKKKKKK